jgi:hypothetical protein
MPPRRRASGSTRYDELHSLQSRYSLYGAVQRLADNQGPYTYLRSEPFYVEPFTDHRQ